MLEQSPADYSQTKQRNTMRNTFTIHDNGSGTHWTDNGVTMADVRHAMQYNQEMNDEEMLVKAYDEAIESYDNLGDFRRSHSDLYMDEDNVAIVRHFYVRNNQTN